MRIILPSELIEQRGIRELGAEKEAIYRELYAPRMIPVAGLAELLEKLRTSGIRLAVGSSGPIENVRMVIEGCGVAPYFDFIVSGDRVSRCKPDPEIYLTAAAGLGLQTAECLIFEDALAGIESARRAGAGRIVALATTCTRETLLKEPNLAYVIEDYTQITDLNDLLN